MKSLSLYWYGLLVVIVVLFSKASNAQELTELWSLEKQFSMPESAHYHADTNQIFVSNVNHYAKDGNGFVSRIAADSKEIELEWLSGLNSPTGISSNADLLYVVDYDALVIADIATREILHRVFAPDEKPSLNDVTISPSGRVFVSGSSSKAIYELVHNKLVVWKQDDELLHHANGLLADQKSLVHGGAIWSTFDLASRALLKDATAPKAAIKEFDGITSDGCGGYLVTLLDDARIWHIQADGQAQPLSEDQIDGIDIHKHANRLYVPRVGGGLSVYQVADNICD